jgi:hypothetical protein
MTVTLADIVREHGGRYCASVPERKILHDIERCRTERMGGHRYRCRGCGREEIAYNSCRNRHCPQCLGTKTGRWLAARVSELLPTQYYHCVFTLPSELRGITLSNRKIVYDLLFKAASETLQEVARGEKHLGAEIGFFGILHTWTQSLEFHPHVHFVVPGGGLSKGQWVAKRGKKFFLPVKVLSRVFRGKFIEYLKRASARGQIEIGNLEALLNKACRTPWVVYCKPPFAGPKAVLKYLSRYTHRIAISNRRLISLKDGQVSFAIRGRRQQGGSRIMTLPAAEFLRRFLLHRVPMRFTRIRHFGFLANRGRHKALALLRTVLKVVPQIPESAHPWLVCSSCGDSRWILLTSVSPHNSS